MRCVASKIEGSQFSLNIFEGIYTDMFEESLYNQQAFSPVESNEGDLFHNYEFKAWNLTPRIYKIIGVSALINLLFLGVVSQTDLLTRKGCDSPFAATVCQVIDAAFIANTLFGTQREYVDAVYEKTELKNADVTFVDVSDAEPPLEYPEGYFAQANPDQAANPDGSYITQGFPSDTSQNDLLNTRPELPKPNPNSVLGSLPTSPLGDSSDSPTVGLNKKRHGQRFPGVNSSTDSNTLPGLGNTTANANTNANSNSNSATASNTPQPPVDEATQDQFGVFINKKPIKDQAKDTIARIDAKEVKLDDPFKVIVAGTLGLSKDGKTVVLKDPTALPVDKNIPNNPAMAKLAQEWILRVGDSGWLGYLDRFDEKKKIKSRRVIISVEQTDTDFKVSVRSEQPSENEARTAASGLNSTLGIAIPFAKGDEQTFLKYAAPTSEGNTLVLNVNIPKPIFQEMVQRKLAEAKEPPAQPSSTAINKPAGNSQGR